MSPTISYFDPGGVMRQAQTDPGGKEMMARGFAQLQQQRQFDERMALEREELGARYQAAENKLLAKRIEDMEKAAQDEVMRQQLMKEAQRRQSMTPEQLQDEEFMETLNQIQDPEAQQKLMRQREATIEQGKYVQAGQQMMGQIPELVEEGVLNDADAQGYLQELEARLASGSPIQDIAQDLQKRRLQHAEQIKADQDWEEVLQYGQEVLARIPPGQQREQMRTQLIDFQAHKSAREGWDPWDIKSQLDEAATGVSQWQGQQNMLSDTFSQLPAMRALMQNPPKGQSPKEAEVHAASGFPGADPGGGHKFERQQLIDHLGVGKAELKALKEGRKKLEAELEKAIRSKTGGEKQIRRRLESNYRRAQELEAQAN